MSKLSFEQTREIFDELGFEYRVAREWRGKVGEGRAPVELPFFESVEFPFTAKEWMGLCRTEGDYYLGGCCGTMSHVQDLIESAFRFGVKWTEIEDIADSMRAHGDKGWGPEASFEELLEAYRENRIEWPMDKVRLIYLMANRFACSNSNCSDNARPPTKDRVSDREQSLHAIANTSHYLWMSGFLNNRVQGVSDEQKSQHRGNEKVALAKLWPHIKAYYEWMAENVDEAFEGVCLYDTERERICENMRGDCIFEKREEAENLMSLWKKWDEEHEEGNESLRKSRKVYEHFVIRPIRITVENGLEFTDDT